MLETVYISRHGFRASWENPMISTSVTKMPRDPPLAGYGLEQAEDLANWVTGGPASTSTSIKPGPLPELVFSSPFYRCIQTAVPLATKLGVEVRLEHGVMEWYSHATEGTGLHPRPASPAKLSQHFAPGVISTSYESTVYPSRRGESLAELQARCDLLVDTWVRRIEAEFPDVKTVIIYGHAASVIALGRSFTGNPTMQVTAGCASTSMYKRRSGTESSGLGGFECVLNGEASYLPKGVERNWSFADIVTNDDGYVIDDHGDGKPFQPSDELPIGVPEAVQKYARKGNDSLRVPDAKM